MHEKQVALIDRDSSMRLTPRLQVIQALAQRDAETRGLERPTVAHVVGAMIWDGGGIGAAELRSLVISERLTGCLDAGPDPHGPLLSAGRIYLDALQLARQRGDHHFGVEHVLHAIVTDAAEWLCAVSNVEDADQRLAEVLPVFSVEEDKPAN